MNREFVEQYLGAFASCLDDVSRHAITSVGEALLAAYERNAFVFLAGNGGSASLASHFACDLEKTTAGKHPREISDRFRVLSLTDSLASLTAWANDEGYEHVFSEALRSRARAGDVLIVISASGNSPNIIAAIERAKAMDVTTIGWLGFDGGKAKDLCDHVLHVRSLDYGIVEAAHGVFTHLVTSWLALQLAERRESAARKAG